MPEPDSIVIQKVIQWLAYADEDIELARYASSKMPGASYRLIAYHAQQCVEKCIKAYLVYRGIDFPYTHNIARLLELCDDTDWREALKDAEELTPYAIATRYPGVDESVSDDEADRAIGIAGLVRQAVHERLRRSGVLD